MADHGLFVAWMERSAIRGNLPTTPESRIALRSIRATKLRQFRDAPRETLQALIPGLAKITGAYDVAGFAKIRQADLHVTTGWRTRGVVLIGDAFATSCPAAGTGTGKVFTDVERLCNVQMSRATYR
jgi:2-polyprenyl-6-methoxyphenol hydroxylase-like FAD-dependent oxidoreductase